MPAFEKIEMGHILDYLLVCLDDSQEYCNWVDQVFACEAMTMLFQPLFEGFTVRRCLCLSGMSTMYVTRETLLMTLKGPCHRSPNFSEGFPVIFGANTRTFAPIFVLAFLSRCSFE